MADEEEEDVLLKETIMANSEPVADGVINPQPRERKKYPKKKYFYEKMWVLTSICRMLSA